MLDYLKLVRWQNLLMLAFMQLLFRYGFLKWQNIPLSLADWQFTLLVISTVLIAAGGYIINNIFDQDTDSVNTPGQVIVGKSISEVVAYNLYFVMNFIGVGIGFYLSNVIERPGFAAIFILVAGTLYIYATSLKQMMIVGNLVVALVLSFSLIIIAIFDLFPATFEGNQARMGNMFSIILDYATFAFLINFIREIVKDLQDVKGDYNQGMNTLPIALGVGRASKVVFGFSLLPIVLLLYYINKYFFTFNLYIITIYSLAFIVGPLIYFSVTIWSAKTSKDFKHLSLILKLVLLFGIISISVLTYNISHNA